MNHVYGNRRGRRGGGRRFGDGGSRWDGGAGSSGGGGHTRNSDWDSREEQGHGGGRRGGGGRGKHPPHLKGREIGLWYAKWGGIKRSDAERKSVSRRRLQIFIFMQYMLVELQ